MNRMLNNDKLPDANNKLDVLKELRKEYEGDKPLIQINEYTQIWNNSVEKSNALDSNGRINLRSQAQSQA